MAPRKADVTGDAIGVAQLPWTSAGVAQHALDQQGRSMNGGERIRADINNLLPSSELSSPRIDAHALTRPGARETRP